MFSDYCKILHSVGQLQKANLKTVFKPKRLPEDLYVLPQPLSRQHFCSDLNVALQPLYLTEIYNTDILVFPPRLLSQAMISWSLKVRL